MKSFIKYNFLGILVLVITLPAIFISSKKNSQLRQELAEARREINQKSQELFANLDTKLEALEKKVLELKTQGYVEPEKFPGISQKIIAATVLVGNAKEITALSKEGEVVIGKEIAPSGNSGTGFFINREGLVATAKHVVEALGRENLIIRLATNNEQLPAEVISLDDKSDIALIKVKKNNTPFVAIGYDENLEVGEEIGFVGYAPNAGLKKPLVHQGVVSAKGVDKNAVKIFTINAFVNKGNSGGPVFSTKTGRVVGIMSARQRDVSSDQFLTLPPNYQSGLKLGGIDPLKFNVDLYNQTLKVIGDVSQVGVGIVYSMDSVQSLLLK